MASHLENHPPSFTWVCPLTRTGKRSAHSTCAKEFAKEMGFQLIETSDDGNCFFYTLAKFAKRSGYEPLLLDSNEHRNAQALRTVLVDHIQDNLYEYEPFLASSNVNSNIQLEELRQNGVWASDAGDLVPVAGANAFGIHINMYNIVDEGDSDRIYLVPIRSQRPSNLYVSIMRVREGHFQLLWPRSGNIHSSSSASASASPAFSNQHAFSNRSANSQHAVIAAAHSAVLAAQVAVQAAQRISPSHSLQNNEYKLNQMVRHLNQLSFNSPSSASASSASASSASASAPTRRSTRSTRSTRSSQPSLSPSRPSKPKPKTRSTRKKSPNHGSYVNNNNELRRALEESLRS